MAEGRVVLDGPLALPGPSPAVALAWYPKPVPTGRDFWTSIAPVLAPSCRVYDASAVVLLPRYQLRPTYASLPCTEPWKTRANDRKSVTSRVSVDEFVSDARW